MRQLSTIHKAGRRLRRKRHIRRRVRGTPDRPRLTVFRTSVHTDAQIIDDEAGRTLCAASTREAEVRRSMERTGNCKAAEEIGRRIAARAREAGITRVVFDRNGFKYHGRVKSLADAARKGGLEF